MAGEDSVPPQGDVPADDAGASQPIATEQLPEETRESAPSQHAVATEPDRPAAASATEHPHHRHAARALPRVAKNPFALADDDATAVIPAQPAASGAPDAGGRTPMRVSALHSEPGEANGSKAAVNGEPDPDATAVSLPKTTAAMPVRPSSPATTGEPATETLTSEQATEAIRPEPATETLTSEQATEAIRPEPVTETVTPEQTTETLSSEPATEVLAGESPTAVFAAVPPVPATANEPDTLPVPESGTTELLSVMAGEEPPATAAESGGVAVATPKTKAKRHHRGLWIGLAAGIVVVGAYFGSAYMFADSVPRGTTIAGVKVGGKSVQDAEAALNEKFGSKSTKPISVKVEDSTASIDPKTAGLSFDSADSLSQYQGMPINPTNWIDYVLGQGDQPLRTDVDTKALSTALDNAGTQVNTQPVNGTIAFVDGQAKVTQPKIGHGIDNSAAVNKISADWLTASQPISLPVSDLNPDIDSADLDAAMAGPVKTLTSGPIEVSIDNHSVELPASAVTAAASMVPKNGTLALSIDPAKITEQVRTRLPEGVETAPQNATFVFEGGKPVLKAGTEGNQIDSAALAASVTQAAGQTSNRTASAKLVKSTPADDQAALQKMGIKEVIGGWETHYNPAEVDRTTNLHVGASRINGHLVKPGETFSLSDTLGPRDYAHGFRDAGVVTEGKLGDGMGGGLSQLSTTLYNASHLSGMVDVEHTPHSQWFSRYPKGREATLWEGKIDNKFKNDTPYGVLIQAWADDSTGTLHVQFWSTKYWTVTSTISDPYNFIAPTTVHQSGAGCVPQAAGSPGFTVVVTRVKTHGSESHTQKWTVNYAPLNKFVCDAKPEG